MFQKSPEVFSIENIDELIQSNLPNVLKKSRSQNSINDNRKLKIEDFSFASNIKLDISHSNIDLSNKVNVLEDRFLGKEIKWI